MNIRKIYKAVEDDEMNSALVSVCFELVEQGYEVRVEGVEYTNDESFTELLCDLENATNEINIEIIKNTKTESFKLVFTDYHTFEVLE